MSNKNIIEDENLGVLAYQDGWGWCAKSFAWSNSQQISVCISDDYVIDSTVSENARNFLNLLQENELTILNQALDKLDCYELINEWIAEGDQSAVVDGTSFLMHSVLDWVFINANGDSELQYVSGGPLLRINVSQDLTISDTYFDGAI